ncbi:hypothetical protein [Mesorhizobium sp. SP-1A]|uniref:hypothetical protein n=1 Tax=Mesorhizobium sp. SP-1A TaxID=3077840 RepID=UPI0028F72D1C|nr:hypothetical protein [Mesorhizobium sp. SP-1A]
MTKLFEKPEDLGEYLFRITDNGGASADRYTVVFSDGDYFALSSYPSSPVGVSQSGEGIDVSGLAEKVEDGQEVDLALGDLEPQIVQHILGRINEGWREFLEAVENKEPHAVAATREDASENEGLRNSAGDGLYWTDDGYMIKKDGDPSEDLGPYTTAREALINTLPDHYSLSGPEYHSTVNDPSSMEKSEGAAEKLAELEAKVNDQTSKPSF